MLVGLFPIACSLGLTYFGTTGIGMATTPLPRQDLVDPGGLNGFSSNSEARMGFDLFRSGALAAGRGAGPIYATERKQPPTSRAPPSKKSLAERSGLARPSRNIRN